MAVASQAQQHLPDPPVGNDEADGGESEIEATRQVCDECRQVLADLQLRAENFGVLLMKPRPSR